MTVKVKYTIEMIREEDIDNWENSNTPEELLKELTEYVNDDLAYIADDLMGSDKDILKIELYKEDKDANPSK